MANDFGYNGMSDTLVKLPRRNSGGGGGDNCQYDAEHFDMLIQETRNVKDAVQAVGAQLGTLNSLHKDIIRYLLIVVCIIALGKSLLEVAQNFWGHQTQKQVAQ